MTGFTRVETVKNPGEHNQWACQPGTPKSLHHYMLWVRVSSRENE